jgi:NAD(P)-dependent dehydrogenase (short-subunit alcohol dehydrogenase family)
MRGIRCVVTGANRGLGLEFVRQMLERGDRVVAGCRDPAGAEALAALVAGSGGRLELLALDVSDETIRHEFAAAMATRFEGLDLLINNACLLVSGERFGTDEQGAMERSFSTNVAGPFLLEQALAKRLAAGERARVVNISSSMGSFSGLGGFHSPSYSISMTALNMASALLAQALNPLGIGVVTLSPGWARTEMGGRSAPLTPAESVYDMLQTLDGLAGERSIPG